MADTQPIDRNANTHPRHRRNWNRLTDILATISGGGVTVLTTKGDLFGFDTGNARIPVGIDGEVLTADSSADTGVSWQTVPATPLAVAGGLEYVGGELTIDLDTSSGLQLSAGGLSIDLDGATLTLSAGGLKISDNGVGKDQLGIITTKGDFIGFSTEPIRVPVGADGAVLTASSGQAAGVEWITPAAGLASPLTTKGDIWVWTSTNARLGVGSNGQMIVADSGVTAGLKWTSPADSSLSFSASGPAVALAATSGLEISSGLKIDLDTSSGLQLGAGGLSIDVDGSTLSLSAAGVRVAADGIGKDELGIVTTKGDLVAFSTEPIRLPIGADGFVLTADAASGAGLKWAAAGTASPLTTKGDLYTFTTVNARLGVGSNGQMIVADSGATAGIKWTGPADSSIAFSASGPGVALATNSGLEISSGLKLDLDTSSGLQLGAGGLSIDVDGSTLSLSAAGLKVADDGIGKDQLGILTTKGDLLTYTTEPVRLAIASEGRELLVYPTAAEGMTWQSKFTFRNRLANGTFQIWQRAATFTATGYTADRWRMDESTGTSTVSRQAFTVGQTDVPFEPQYFLRFVQTTAGAAAPFLEQRMEDVRTLANRTVTISFWAKADAARTLTVSLIQNFGGGGSGPVTTAAGTVPATTVWTRFSLTVGCPGISGKTIDVSHYLALRLALPNTSGITVEFWGVQIEDGAVMTMIELPPFGLELARCQRYYHTSYQFLDQFPGSTSSTTQNIVGFVAGGTAGEYGFMVFYPVEMRVNPTKVYYSPSTGASGKRNNASDGVDENMTGVNTEGVRSHGGGPGNVAGKVYRYHYTADSEL